MTSGTLYPNQDHGLSGMHIRVGINPVSAKGDIFVLARFKRVASKTDLDGAID